MSVDPKTGIIESLSEIDAYTGEIAYVAFRTVCIRALLDQLTTPEPAREWQPGDVVKEWACKYPRNPGATFYRARYSHGGTLVSEILWGVDDWEPTSDWPVDTLAALLGVPLQLTKPEHPDLPELRRALERVVTPEIERAIEAQIARLEAKGALP